MTSTEEDYPAHSYFQSHGSAQGPHVRGDSTDNLHAMADQAAQAVRQAAQVGCPDHARCIKCIRVATGAIQASLAAFSTGWQVRLAVTLAILFCPGDS